MNKFVRFIQNYLLVGFPFVIACMVWETLHPEIALTNINSIPEKILWNGLGINLMCWFAMLIVFLVILVVVPSIREKTLRRLANLKERDEREQYITGKASRAAYISTLSLMIFFLFMSVLSVSIEKLPNDQASEGHRLTANIGLHFNLLNDYEANKNPEVKVLFDSRNITPSSSAIIFILLGWQLMVFNLAARKEK